MYGYGGYYYDHGGYDYGVSAVIIIIGDACLWYVAMNLEYGNILRLKPTRLGHSNTLNTVCDSMSFLGAPGMWKDGF